MPVEATTDPAEAAADRTDAAAAHEAGRLRGPMRVLRWGPVAAFLLAVGSGLLGAGGGEGFFLFLLLLALTFGVTGVWVGGGLLLDEFRGAPTSRRRAWLTAGMFLAALLCMTAVGGVAATLGEGS